MRKSPCRELLRDPDARYLLFWPVFGIRYLLIEHFHPARSYHVMYCPLDDRIPFLEVFVIPYLLWHVYIIGTHLYCYFRDREAFRFYSWFLIVSITISTTIFLLYPSCQELRPEVYPRDNLLTGLVELLHCADTNTNVCPSEHVIGAVGAWLALSRCNALKGTHWIPAALVLSVLTAVATVFLKQHSVIDLAAAVPVCVIAAAAARRIGDRRHSGEIPPRACRAKGKRSRAWKTRE